MKTPLFYLVIIISLSFPCCGQKKDKKDQPSASVNNPGFPKKPIGWVSDFDSVFTPAQAVYLDSLMNAHEVQTTNEIAVVTLQPGSYQIITPGDFDAFAFSLFKEWGIGKKDKNNGIGILVSVDLRKIRIEVGKGLALKLTDEEAKNIIDTIIVPEFKKGNYFTGILSGLRVIFKEIE
ncbi:MAG: TPM domain-containing protein [Ferruginibacter sp.]|nr:TPM domain-containing protein [Chitinophagaceae bacterium]